MKRWIHSLLIASSWVCAGAASAGNAPVSIEIVAPDGRTFREFPVNTHDGALRSYLQAEKGARYEVRVRNTSGERLGLVIAVDGRNIISGKKSDLARGEPMYVLDAGAMESYAGWRANLDAINEFYFTDWTESYAEAFGDRSARGVIAVAVYREDAPPPVHQPSPEIGRERAAKADGRAGNRSRDETVGTGYGDRRIDRAVEIDFVAQTRADSRHFIKYEWRDTLCRRLLIECGEKNRFWDEATLGFAPPPQRR